MSDTHIKINAVTPRVQYTGNGVTTTFPYEFAIFDETDMVVYVDNDIIESGYTVTGAGETEGGTVVFSAAPADGKKVTLLRNVPIERVTDFQEGGTFRPKNLNDEFDRQTAFVQQVQEKLDRAVVVGPTSDVNPEQVLTQVERVYASIDNVDAVADDITNVNTVASNISKVQTTANNISNVNTVASNISNVNTVSSISSNVTAVAGNATNINAVAGNATNINAVNSNKTNINAVAGNSSNINTVATNISDVNNCASNMSAITDAPNQAQAAADSAALAYQYGNDKINQTHISNCITEIPQVVKLQLSSGAITLKAGSKVYMPNGPGVFVECTNSTDLSYTPAWGAGYKCFVVARVDANNKTASIGMCRGDLQSSGTTQPVSGTNGEIWYDTSANKIKTYRSGSWVADSVSEGRTLFLGIVTVGEGNVITSIDKVFNGFGYIGSTVFALPRVKGLMPNGRNSNGTLKNTLFTTSSVLTYTRASSYANYDIILKENDIASSPVTYDEEINYNKNSSNVNVNYTIVGKVSSSNNAGAISYFDTKDSFHALDWNDKRTIAGYAMPSGVYENLTSTNGSTYTAPANGYVCFKNTGSETSSIQGYIENQTKKIVSTISSYYNTGGGFVPVSKGDVVYLSKGSGVGVSYYRFVYAEGEV